MTFFQRLSYYGFGFILGIGLLLFFLNEKGAGCDYLPNARILKLIREKPFHYSEDALKTMQTLHIDSTAIKAILVNGDIDFSKSKTHTQPCRFYWIEGVANKKKVVLHVKNCKDEATIDSLTVNPK